jgi:mannose-6-phosphate isomerase-like protein (cupin superfamily)
MQDHPDPVYRRDEIASRSLEPGRLSSLALRHGTLELRWYAPQGSDPQTPHDKDEVYVVVTGSGWFICGDRRDRFGPGDALFVRAGEIHRFEDFTPDFATWVVFYGPKGGETP